MGVKTEYKKTGRVELEFEDCEKCSCIVIAESNADIIAMARGWLYECLTAKKVTAFYGLTDIPLISYVRDDNRCINFIK